MAKETLIYIVDPNLISNKDLLKSVERLVKTVEDDEIFMDIAEEQGTVYSLPGFEQAFSEFNYPREHCIMRIIEVEMAQ